MKNEEFATDAEIDRALQMCGFTRDTPQEGRLMLLELLAKAGAGYRSSHTEEGFLGMFGMMKADRTPNKRGRRFLCSMIYKHSSNRPECYELMKEFRQDA